MKPTLLQKIQFKIKQKMAQLNPKSTKAIFAEIYTKKTWGDDGTSKFYSGTGSDDSYSEPYVDVIVKLIKENRVSSLVDLGCGDFRIGKKITDRTGVRYIGIDIVPDLIKYNNGRFGSDRIQFMERNIVKDKLPKGQMCLVRQVLQHLSNVDIQKILSKCVQFEYVIITEHLPAAGEIVPNLDKKSDADIRLSHNSGVFLDSPPFNKKVEELVTVYPEIEENSKIVTYRVFL